MFSFHKHKSILIGAVFGLWAFSSLVMANSEKGWMVQLSSFREEKNAERFISRIKKKGYTPFVIKEENSQWHKVRVGPYSSKEEARQVVRDLKKNQGISAMVILSQEGPPDSTLKHSSRFPDFFYNFPAIAFVFPDQFLHAYI